MIDVVRCHDTCTSYKYIIEIKKSWMTIVDEATSFQEKWFAMTDGTAVPPVGKSVGHPNSLLLDTDVYYVSSYQIRRQGKPYIKLILFRE